MSGFEASWLELREPVDHRARHAGLRRLAIEVLTRGEAEATVVDLGCGTGSTFRALSPEAENHHWRLVDNDLLLLEEARARHGRNERIEFMRLDLAALPADVFSGARLVTASALFDLVSAEMVEALSVQIGSGNTSLYAALNYDGCCRWSSRDPADEVVVTAFNQHQRQDKGLGAALGPESGPVLKTIFEAAGFKVLIAPSPWHFGPDDAELQRQFIEGMVKAVAETRILAPSFLENWRRNRLAQIDSSTCEVGHWDVLALAGD
jgi:SAM-dependent methyltransferase